MKTVEQVRERLRFDGGWRFYRGDIELPPLMKLGETGEVLKAGSPRGPAGSGYDDGSWEAVDLPHDWVVGGKFDPACNIDHGYLPRGIGWYRKRFTLAEADRGRRMGLEFDGVLTQATVWVNGHLVRRHFGGYMGFCADISDVANFGEKENVVAVKVEATEFEGWWYEGAGLYRHVWLEKTHTVHVARWGVWVKPVREADGEWRTVIETRVADEGEKRTTENAGRRVWVRQRILDGEGKAVGEDEGHGKVEAGEERCVRQEIRVRRPRIWSLEDPALYRLETVVGDEATGMILDRVETPFGYRHLRFDTEKGFFLNDRPVKIRGTCNHQDHAGVGAAVPDSLWDYRIRRLLAMGSNAYRCAHNPPAPELLEACDRLGMLVLDENRQFRVAQEELADLAAMVKRDRNHPSVFAWCLFNEEGVEGTEQGARMARTMKGLVRRLDDSRPVTAAMRSGWLEKEGVGQVVDVVGINYSQKNYDAYHQLYPRVPILATEMTAALMTRGQYAVDEARCYYDAYDRTHAHFGAPTRMSWRQVADREFVMGGFVWTGFDYRGEPWKYAWPCISSHFGILDTCGFAKDAFYLYQAMWRSEPMVHLLPHWNWAGQEGQEILVWCYSNCEEVELFLNGRSTGICRVGPFEPGEWLVPYTPGVLRAEGRNGGRRVAETTVETTGAAVRLGLECDRAALRADGRDAAAVTVFAADAAGRRVPTAGNLVRFSISGSGRIIGVGNGDPCCHESDKGRERSLFNGLAQAIIQAGEGVGKVVFCAESERLTRGELAVDVGPQKKASPSIASPVNIE